MAESLSTVALLVANPALASILVATLASRPGLRVREFDSEKTLLAYTSISRAEIVILDFDSAEPADETAIALRAGLDAPRRILALAGSRSGDIRAASLRAGIDEVLMKPMSPKYLLERVAACLATSRRLPGLHYERRRPAPADWSRHGANVVSLFADRPDVRP